MSNKKQRRKTLISGSLIALIILFVVFMGGYMALFLVANHMNFIWPVCHIERVLDVFVGLFLGNVEMLAQGLFILILLLVLLGLIGYGIYHSVKCKRLNAIFPMVAVSLGFAALVDVMGCMTRDYTYFGGYVYLIAGSPDMPNEAINTARLLVGLGIIVSAFVAAFLGLALYTTAIKDQRAEVKAVETRKERNAKFEEALRKIVREELEAFFESHSVEATPVEEPAPVVEEPAPVVEEPAPVVEEPAPVVEEPAPVDDAAKVERIPFGQRLKDADEILKYNYNVIKSELLSYGLKSRLSHAGDTFRLHRKTYARIVVAGKGLKVYFALDPKDYADSTIPVIDVSNKNIYAEIPLAFKVKSDLSVKRCKQLIADVCKADGYEQGEVEVLDWVSHVEDVVTEDEED